MLADRSGLRMRRSGTSAACRLTAWAYTTARVFVIGAPELWEMAAAPLPQPAIAPPATARTIATAELNDLPLIGPRSAASPIPEEATVMIRTDLHLAARTCVVSGASPDGTL